MQFSDYTQCLPTIWWVDTCSGDRPAVIVVNLGVGQVGGVAGWFD